MSTLKKLELDGKIGGVMQPSGLPKTPKDGDQIFVQYKCNIFEIYCINDIKNKDDEDFETRNPSYSTYTSFVMNWEYNNLVGWYPLLGTHDQQIAVFWQDFMMFYIDRKQKFDFLYIQFCMIQESNEDAVNRIRDFCRKHNMKLSCDDLLFYCLFDEDKLKAHKESIKKPSRRKRYLDRVFAEGERSDLCNANSSEYNFFLAHLDAFLIQERVFDEKHFNKIIKDNL